MLTKAQAINASHNAEFHYGECTRKVGPRGGVKESTIHVRVSGRCQTWKTRPEDFRLPVKYGLYESSAIDQTNAASYHAPEDCPLRGTVGPIPEVK